MHKWLTSVFKQQYLTLEWAFMHSITNNCEKSEFNVDPHLGNVFKRRKLHSIIKFNLNGPSDLRVWLDLAEM